MKPEAQVKGGIALQERGSQSSEDAEKNEPDKSRSVDQIDNILREAFGKDVGPCVLEQMFYIDVPFSRPIDITFDRFYPGIGLLVHSFSVVSNMSGAEDAQMKDDLADHDSYARQHGYNFLPIIAGEIDPETLTKVVTMKPSPDRKSMDVDVAGLMEQRSADRRAEADATQAEAMRQLQERNKAQHGPEDEEEDEDEALMEKLKA